MPSGGTASLASNETVTLDEGSTLDNLGTVTSSNGYLLFGYYRGAGNEPNRLLNHGTWTVSNTSNDPFYDPYVTASVTNSAGGTLNFSPALATDTVPRNSAALVNNGTVNVTKGHLANSVNGSGSGTYNLGTNTTWEQNGANLGLSGSQFTGTGTFNMNGGSVSTSTSATLPTTTKLHGGTLKGGGHVHRALRRYRVAGQR